MARFSLALAAALVLVAACSERVSAPADPLASARERCGAGEIEACSQLIATGELGDGDRAAAYADRGAGYEERGDASAALRDYAAALDLDPNNMKAVRGRAAVLIASGQFDAADLMVRALVRSGQFGPDAHFLAGEIALGRSDYMGAVAEYDQALAADPRMARALASRGRAKQLSGDSDGALADFNAAIGIDQGLARAYAGRCWVRLAAKDADFNAARADADEAVRADAANVDGQVCRGVLQLRAGEWAGARASFDAALAIEPGNPMALFGRGVARRRSGDGAGTRDMNLARDFDRHIGERFDELGVRTY